MDQRDQGGNPGARTTRPRVFQQAKEVAQSPRIRLVTVDLMGTILMAVRGFDRMRCEVYRKYAGIPTTVKWTTIRQIIAKHRKQFASTLDEDDFWQYVNARVLGELNPEQFSSKPVDGETNSFVSAVQTARSIHEEIQGNDKLWCVPGHEWRDLLHPIIRLREQTGVPFYVASNQRKATGQHMVATFNLADVFSGVYTSEFLGARKPHKAFVDAILERHDVRPSEILHIGNSLDNDVPLRQWGPRVIAFIPDDRRFSEFADPDGEYMQRYGRDLESGRLLVARTYPEITRLISGALVRSPQGSTPSGGRGSAFSGGHGSGNTPFAAASA